ncbi:MAG TPA: hydroxyisourate hydrolase [Chloroflexia bacterium]|nr:hydroxyisourate hydrolase [Chloroflexia bacterium]
MGKLTTHVLDTAQGRPAAGMEIELWRLNSPGEARTLVKCVYTNGDGRTEGGPILEGEEFTPGTYELVFMVGDYFAEQEVTTSDPPFLDRVPIRFTIASPTAHYHVPLLASPWAYSTYRGS